MGWVLLWPPSLGTCSCFLPGHGCFYQFLLLSSAFPEKHPQSTGQSSPSCQKAVGSSHPVLMGFFTPGRARPWMSPLLSGRAGPAPAPGLGAFSRA